LAQGTASAPRKPLTMSDDVVTVERLERALAVCAYIIVRHGEDVTPLFERIERDLAGCDRNRTP
jgi:hypothetical protein